MCSKPVSLLYYFKTNTMEDTKSEWHVSEKAKELAGKVTDYVNSFDREKNKQFAKAMSREHRTLQQSTMRLMLETIEYMASDDYSTDPRNEQSKTVAQRLLIGFAKEVALEQNIPVEQVIGNWDAYRPSKWLGTI